MTVTDSNTPIVPDFNILINGSEISIETKAHIAEVNIDMDHDMPNMFTIELFSSDTQDDWSRSISEVSELPWIDDQELFSIGNEVEIQIGYINDLETVIKAEITGLEPKFTSDSLPSLIVRGYDRGHRLLRGRKTRTFKQNKDSDIAFQIANEQGLTPEVEDSGVVHEYVVQANQTDMDFLRERAGRINYEFMIEDRTLFFNSVKNAESEVLTLTFNNDLLEFSPRMSAARQVSEVIFGGWDPKGKSEVFGTGKKGDELTKMGGDSTGAEIAEGSFEEVSANIGDRPFSNQAEADQMAKARFNDLILSFIRGEGVCRGRTDLRAGKVVQIEGVGTRFSGKYYLVSTIHSYSSRYGYYTKFSFRRNAS